MLAEAFTVKRGQIPVVINASHGGRRSATTLKQEDFFATRKQREGGPTVVTVRDADTAELAMLVAERVRALCGASPFVIANNVDRAFVDTNRNKAGGVEPGDAFGAAFHGEYYAHVSSLVREAAGLSSARSVDTPKGAAPRVLLIDVHGQAADTNAVFIGTQNGRTASRERLYSPGRGLVAQLASALAAGDGVMGSSKRVRVEPSDAGSSEDARFNGGNMVYWAGDKHGAGKHGRVGAW